MWIQRICKRAKRPTVDTNGKALNGGHKKDFKETIRRGKGNLKKPPEQAQKKGFDFSTEAFFCFPDYSPAKRCHQPFFFGLGAACSCGCSS